MFGGLNLANAFGGGQRGYGMFGGSPAPAGSGGLMDQVSSTQQLNPQMAMPSGGPNVQQQKPAFPSMAQAIPMTREMQMPSGGPNMPTPLPTSGGPMPEMGGPAEPTNPIVRAICGLPPAPTGTPTPNGPPTALTDLFNRPTPSFGGGMAPSVPHPVDLGLGGQQMGFGNGMGSMSNWFSNFTAPRPPAMAAPAPMMPMKGMFGVR